MMRIIILIGWIRVIMKQEFVGFKINKIDKTLLWFCMASIITFTILHQTSDAFINRLGDAYNAIGIYFLVGRIFVKDIHDINRLIKTLVLISVLLAIFMLVEKLTGNNFFGMFGGVPSKTLIRFGRLRCQGPFAHPILAGTFGATLIPLFVSLWWEEKPQKIIPIIGVISATIITITSGSSGPLVTYLASIFAIIMWRYRKHTRIFLVVFAWSLIVLQVIMKARVWFLIGRLSWFIGGTGWHRASLIDAAFNNFGDWWLIGTKTTDHWGFYLFDITNQYILVGVRGGIITLLLFIAVIVLCFRAIGYSLQEKEIFYINNQKILWCLGAALFSHVITFLAVSYFDQLIMFWYLLLAIISSICGSYILNKGKDKKFINYQPSAS